MMILLSRLLLVLNDLHLKMFLSPFTYAALPPYATIPLSSVSSLFWKKYELNFINMRHTLSQNLFLSFNDVNRLCRRLAIYGKFNIPVTPPCSYRSSCQIHALKGIKRMSESPNSQIRRTDQNISSGRLAPTFSLKRNIKRQIHSCRYLSSVPAMLLTYWKCNFL